ncbi:MAG: DUF1015 family protein [Acidimicrobiales bacterium]
MPRFEAFAGIRYDTARVDLADVTAPPYDVIDADDRAALARRHPNNVVRIDCPTPDDCGQSGPGGQYLEAASRLRRWLGDGVLVRDPVPSLYLYRMGFTDDHGRRRHTTGVLGAVGLEPPGEGDVLPHERTTRKDRSDRLELLRVTRANLSPIWFLSLARGLTKLLDPPGDPLASWTDDSGVDHSLWRLSEPAAIDAIRAAVAAAPLVIADGHHRYETSIAYRDARRAADDNGEGATDDLADLTLGFVVELVADELDVEPIHRLVAGLPDGTDLLGTLASGFRVGPVEATDESILDRMDATGAMALVLADGVRLLRPSAELAIRAGDLDTAMVDLALAAVPPHEVTFQPGLASAVDAVACGRAQAAFLVRPPAIDQIADVAHRRQRMPPKTTYFWPKPRTGLVFRSLG